MLFRERFDWVVQLADERTGEQVEYKVSNHWSPSHEGVEEGVLRSAVAEARILAKVPYVGLTVQRALPAKG